MGSKDRIVIKHDRQAVIKSPVQCNKCTIEEYIPFKLWCYIAFIAFLFAFGCKQKTGGKEQKKQIPTPGFSNEITITVKGDLNLTVKTPNTFEVNKKLTWNDIKQKAQDKIIQSANYAIKEWRFNDADGEILTDTTTFNEDKTVFAVSKLKDEVTHNADSVSFKMKLIPTVKDTVLGDNNKKNNKERKVSLSDYYIGETEVTQELWKAVMGSNPSHFTDSVKNPVEKVSWYDCVAFCNKLTEQVMSKEDCVYDIKSTLVTADWNKKGFRLPTEAEWEYAAMGGQRHKYAGCDLETELKDYAWYKLNSANKTHEVATKKANRFGLYDMSGNLWEWCWDCWSDSTPDGGDNPIGVASGDYRICRGGSFFFDASNCESAFRDSGDLPSRGGSGLGLRLVYRP